MNLPELLPSLLRIISALAVTVGVIIVAAYLFKKIVKKGEGEINGRELIKILSAKYLGPSSSIALIDVLGNIMVIGVSSSTISLLTEIVDSQSLEQLKDIQERKGKNVPFSGYFSGYLKGADKIFRKQTLESLTPGLKGADKIFRKQTLESLTPGILDPSSPTKLEKNLSFKT